MSSLFWREAVFKINQLQQNIGGWIVEKYLLESAESISNHMAPLFENWTSSSPSTRSRSSKASTPTSRVSSVTANNSYQGPNLVSYSGWSFPTSLSSPPTRQILFPGEVWTEVGWFFVQSSDPQQFDPSHSSRLILRPPFDPSPSSARQRIKIFIIRCSTDNIKHLIRSH